MIIFVKCCSIDSKLKVKKYLFKTLFIKMWDIMERARVVCGRPTKFRFKEFCLKKHDIFGYKIIYLHKKYCKKYYRIYVLSKSKSVKFH